MYQFLSGMGLTFRFLHYSNQLGASGAVLLASRIIISLGVSSVSMMLNARMFDRFVSAFSVMGSQVAAQASVPHQVRSRVTLVGDHETHMLDD